MQNGTALFAKRHCTVCKTVLHCLQNGTALFAKRHCTVCKTALHCLQNKELKQERNTESTILKLPFVLQVKLTNKKNITAVSTQTH
jgi:hypothetical protein